MMTTVDRTLFLKPLQDNINALSERDRTFAASLLDQVSRRGLSEKQWDWVEILAKRAMPKPEPVETETIDLSKLLKLFNHAAEGLQRPKVAFSAEGVGDFIVSRAGDNSSNPGHLYVKDVDNNYLGKVDPKGRLHMARHAEESHGDVFQALEGFAQNPEAAAAAYGKSTGICCFCCRKLTDDRSVEVGYGPICAEKWGLPWGA